VNDTTRALGDRAVPPPAWGEWGPVLPAAFGDGRSCETLWSVLSSRAHLSSGEGLYV